MSQRPTIEERAERDAMRLSSMELSNAIYTARAGSVPQVHRRLVWSTHVGQNDGSAKFMADAAIAEQRTARNAFIDTLRISPRDPCPKCGTRGDVGCKHRKAQ